MANPERRKCAKPGCGAHRILGHPCTDWDCPQQFVSAADFRDALAAESLFALRAAPAGNELVERLNELAAVLDSPRGAHGPRYAEFVREAARALSTIRLQALEEAAKVKELQAEIERLQVAIRLPDAQRRLWFLSDHLAKLGYFNRSDLRQAFGISTPQASADIGRWMKLHPEAAIYNQSAKRYEVNTSQPSVADRLIRALAQEKV